MLPRVVASRPGFDDVGAIVEIDGKGETVGKEEFGSCGIGPP